MTNPTNPAHSVFTVTVQLNDLYYDVEITPILNGKLVEDVPVDRLAEWKGAEQSHKVYSRTLNELFCHSTTLSDKLSALAADGCLTVMGFEEEFIFPDKSVVNHDDKVKEVWDNFVRYLHDPESGKDELGPLDTDNKGTSIETNSYLKLGSEEQKAVRKGLLEKNYRKIVRGKTTIKMKYTEVEKSCIREILGCNIEEYLKKNQSKKVKLKTDNPLNDLTIALWHKLGSEEQEEFSGLLEEIIEQEEALKATKATKPVRLDHISLDSDLETSTDDEGALDV
jgi:hypothetical protein